MRRTQALHIVAVLTVPTFLLTSAMGASPSRAASGSASPSPPPHGSPSAEPHPPPPVGEREGSAPRVPASRDSLDTLYRNLFEIHVRVSRTDDPALADSLRRVEKGLLERIHGQLASGDSLAPRLEILRDLDVPEAELDEFLAQLERLGSQVDWEELGQIIETSLDDIGEGLGQLGEFLQDIDINSDDVRFDDPRSGDRVRIVLPPEVRKNVAEGLQALQQQLQEALQDTVSHDLRRELESLGRYLPEQAADRLARRVPRWRKPKRKIVAQSVLRFGEDFELGEDEAVQGDVVVVGGDCYLSGEVQGSVYCLGDIFVEDSGTIGKDAISLFGEVSLDGDSSVHGRRFDIGNVAPGFFAAYWGQRGSLALVVHGVKVAVLALLLIMATAIAGDRLRIMSEHAETNALRDLLSGGLWLAVAVGGFVVSAVGLAITVIGIPVVVVLAVAFAGLLFSAYFVACRVLGVRLLAMVGSDRPATPWMASLLGLAILEIPSFLAASTAPWVGPSSVLLQVLDWLFKFMAISIGFGAIVATRFGVKLTAGTARSGESMGPSPVQNPSA